MARKSCRCRTALGCINYHSVRGCRIFSGQLPRVRKLLCGTCDISVLIARGILLRLSQCEECWVDPLRSRILPKEGKGKNWKREDGKKKKKCCCHVLVLRCHLCRSVIRGGIVLYELDLCSVLILVPETAFVVFIFGAMKVSMICVSLVRLDTFDALAPLHVWR